MKWWKIVLVVFGLLIVISVLIQLLEERNTPVSSTAIAPAAKVTQLTKAAQHIKKNHPDWSDNICNNIVHRQVSIGMTKAQVIASWGKPSRIMSSSDSRGTIEVWFYGSGTKNTLQLVNDTLLTIMHM